MTKMLLSESMGTACNIFENFSEGGAPTLEITLVKPRTFRNALCKLIDSLCPSLISKFIDKRVFDEISSPPGCY